MFLVFIYFCFLLTEKELRKMKLLPYLLKILINIESFICTFYKNEPKILLLERITVFEKTFLKIHQASQEWLFSACFNV